MKKTKENVYVVIDTLKKARKVKKVLDIFGERSSRTIKEPFRNEYLYFDSLGEYDTAQLRQGCFTKGKTEVSIKELRNILAVEHLKEGDVVVCKEGKGEIAVGIYKDHDKFGFDLRPCVFLDDNKKSEGCFDTFIRYSTEEEKALLEDEPKSIEVGKWYKGIGDKLIFTTSDEQEGRVKAYGFGAMGGWFEDDHDFTWTTDELKEATKEEVEQSLIKEAKKRGYADGVKVHSLGHDKQMVIYNQELNTEYESYYNKLWFGVGLGETNHYVVVFQDGKWAEIVEPSFVESSDKIKVAGENIGKRVRVIDGGSGATGCNGQTGIIVEKPKKNRNGSLHPVIYVKLDNGHTWGLAMDHKIEYLQESLPLTVSLEIKDIATLQVIQKTLKELEEKLTKLI